MSIGPSAFQIVIETIFESGFEILRDSTIHNLTELFFRTNELLSTIIINFILFKKLHIDFSFHLNIQNLFLVFILDIFVHRRRNVFQSQIDSENSDRFLTAFDCNSIDLSQILFHLICTQVIKILADK